MSSSGAVLDTSGIRVCGAAGDQYEPQVASGDSGYLAVWTDDRFYYDYIFAGRVARSGAVLDGDGIQVTFDSAYRDLPHVAFGGTGYLVVWEEEPLHSSHFEICGARLDQSGAVIDSEPILIAGGNYDCWSPSVAFDGTDYIVTWYSGRVNGARVNRWGTVLDTFPVSQRQASSASLEEMCLTSGPNRQALALYSAPTDSVNHRSVSCDRIWGRLSPFEGIKENPTQVAPRMTLDVLPNPLSNNGVVRYALPTQSHVRLAIYDISGRLARLLADDEQKPGAHVLRWNGTTDAGRLLANGVYILCLDANGRSETRTLTIAR